VVDVGESVDCGQLGYLLFEGWGGYLVSESACSAYQVVVVAADATAPEEHSAVDIGDHVDGTALAEDMEGPVDGGEADPLPGGAQAGVQVLGGLESVCAVEMREDPAELTGLPGPDRRLAGWQASGRDGRRA
jgi:hypothetical protein